jgi:hypothetical protein
MRRAIGIKGDHLDGEVLEAMRLVLPTIVSSVPDDVRTACCCLRC